MVVAAAGEGLGLGQVCSGVGRWALSALADRCSRHRYPGNGHSRRNGGHCGASTRGFVEVVVRRL